jgi:choice-of-anchor C domain-containing protein
MRLAEAFLFSRPSSDDQAPQSRLRRAADDHPSTAPTGILIDGGTTVFVLSLLRAWKPARNSINRSRRHRSRPSLELLDVRALLSNLLINGDFIPPTVVGLQPFVVPHQSTTNYSVWAGKVHRLGRGDDRIIPIRSARYDAASQSVNHRLVHRQPLHRTLSLTSTGASPGGLTNASGTPWAGVGAVGSSSDHVVRLDHKTLERSMLMGLLPDGGFETPKIHPRKKARTLFAGNPALAPWRITSGSVNVQTYWPAAEGTHTLDLNGVSAGTIEQSFATIPGQFYQLMFDYGNNPDAHVRTAGATVTVAGLGTLLSQDIAHTGSTPRDMKYTRFFGFFLADSTTTTLKFTSTTAGAYGVVLDAVSVTTTPFESVTYTLTDLGTLPGGDSSEGLGVNDYGQVVGFSSFAGGAEHAFLAGPGGGPLKDLGTLGGDVSEGLGVNDYGQVAGFSYIAGNTVAHAFLSGPGGGPLKDLGTLGGIRSAGYAVNASGQVVGSSETADGLSHAFLSGPGGGPLKDLGTLSGVASDGLAVNASGQVAGVLYTAQHAFLSGPGGGPLKDLGTLSGDGSGGYAVNASGQVAGWSFIAGGAQHAFLSGPGGGPLKDLGTLPGFNSSYSYSEGLGVNDYGQVVGDSGNLTSGPFIAFLYSGGQMLDLNSLIAPGSGFTLMSASGISDTGYIAGVGMAPDGQQHAFLLTPVPEQ